MTPNVQMCTVDDLTGEEPCLRMARWEWRPDGPDGHPVHLCNFHAEPFNAPPTGATSPVPAQTPRGEQT